MQYSVIKVNTLRKQINEMCDGVLFHVKKSSVYVFKNL